MIVKKNGEKISLFAKLFLHVTLDLTLWDYTVTCIFIREVIYVLPPGLLDILDL